MSVDKLRAEKERQKLSGRALAAKLKASPATLQRVLSGSRQVTPESAAAAATWLANPEGPPPALEPVGTQPRRRDFRLTLDEGQRERLERLAQDMERDPGELLQDLAMVLLWPGPPSRVRSRFFRMTGQGWGRRSS